MSYSWIRVRVRARVGGVGFDSFACCMRWKVVVQISSSRKRCRRFSDDGMLDDVQVESIFKGETRKEVVVMKEG
jgi:hypothetical protein